MPQDTDTRYQTRISRLAAYAPALRGPVERFLEQERLGVAQEMEWLAEEYSPFRQTG